MDYRKANIWQLLVLIILLNFPVQAIHESAHWAVYQVFGRGPVWGFTSLVQIWGETPLHPDEWVKIVDPDGVEGWVHLASTPSKTEETVMNAAGPLGMLLGIIAALGMARLGRSAITKQMGLLFALIGSFVFSQYYLRNLFRSGNGDEYFIASYLGVPKVAIDIPLGLAFLACFILGLRALGSWRIGVKWMGAVLLGSFPTGVFLMQANNIVQEQIDQGNPFFRPVLGFSLPVVLVNGIVFIGLALWWYKASRLPARSTQLAG
jgi:hypothetical protein